MVRLSRWRLRSATGLPYRSEVNVVLEARYRRGRLVRLDSCDDRAVRIEEASHCLLAHAGGPHWIQPGAIVEPGPVNADRAQESVQASMKVEARPPRNRVGKLEDDEAVWSNDAKELREVAAHGRRRLQMLEDEPRVDKVERVRG